MTLKIKIKLSKIIVGLQITTTHSGNWNHQKGLKNEKYEFHDNRNKNFLKRFSFS